MHPHTDLAHRLWVAYLEPGDLVVDATAGNGHDTLALVRALGQAGGGICYACDIQKAAVESAQERLRTALSNDGWEVVEGYSAVRDREDLSAEWMTAAPSGAEIKISWHVECHADMLSAMPHSSARLVVFNLGYLPGGDKNIVTTAESTVVAFQAAERVVQAGGAISATLYPGHQEGMLEAEAALDHASELPMQQWSVYHHQWINNRNKRSGMPAPSLLHIQRIHDD